MAYTQQDIDTLKAAMAQGVSEVRYVSGSVTYRSLDDMMKTLKLMEAEINPTGAVSSRTVARFERGF